MSEILLNIIAFALLPAAAAIAGAIIAGFRPPSAKMRSVIQHFAAGVVFSVVAVVPPGLKSRLMPPPMLSDRKL